MRCSLCISEVVVFSEVKERTYYKCIQCEGIMLDPSHFLSANREKDRYDLHQNDVNDLGYQQSVSPIVNEILKRHTYTDNGLDFGSGKAPIITHLLQDKSYNITPYDPFFNPDDSALEKKYEYIICCEVIEHFYTPSKEFEILQSMLASYGTLYCKTKIYNPSIDFDSWWYKNDPTHVFFYSNKTIEWIKDHFKYDSIIIQNDLIILKKGK